MRKKLRTGLVFVGMAAMLAGCGQSAATATTAASCSGNAATATTADNLSGAITQYGALVTNVITQYSSVLGGNYVSGISITANGIYVI